MYVNLLDLLGVSMFGLEIADSDATGEIEKLSAVDVLRIMVRTSSHPEIKQIARPNGITGDAVSGSEHDTTIQDALLLKIIFGKVKRELFRMDYFHFGKWF